MDEEIEFEALGTKYLLKPVQEIDLGWIYDLMTNEKVRQNFFSQKKFSKEEHLAYWHKKLKQESFKAMAIFLGEEPVGLVRLDEKDISIAVKPEHWGKEIAFNALSQLDLSKSIARVKPGNQASIKLFKRLGFKEKFVEMEK